MKRLWLKKLKLKYCPQSSSQFSWHIKLIFLLLIILLINSSFGLINSTYFDSSNFTKFIYKIIMAFIVVYLLIQKRFFFKIPSAKNIALSSIFSFGLIVLAFIHLSKSLGAKDVNISQESIFIFLLYCLAVGLFEELLFRKFSFEYIKRSIRGQANHLWKAVIVTSIIFALAHSANFFNKEIIRLSIINQIFFALGIGFILQALLIKFKNLIIIVALHGVINFLGSYKAHLLVNAFPKKEEVYTMSDFWGTLIALIIFNIITISISRIIITKELVNANSM